jgi:hypothetical protein
MPIDIQTLPAASINTKWKEPYASASLNRRPVGITPYGIYRGLVLSEDPATGDRTVVVVADPTNTDHVAVIETEDGFSINYRDGGSGDIVLSLTSYLGVDVKVCLAITYQIGASTTGSFRTYTQAEFDSLTISFKNTLIVLGTVTVPGTTSTPIPGSSISLTGRTLASSNIQKGTVQNAPLGRNPSFEIGEVGATDQHSSNYWDKSSSAGTGVWNTSTVRALVGTKSIQLSVSSGPFTGILEQRCGIETVAGELFACEIAIWQEKTISSGTFTFFVKWTDSTGAAIVDESQQDLDGGVDSGWRSINPIFAAPAGAVAIRSFGIRALFLDPSVTGIFAYLDTINVFVEPSNPQLPYAFDQRYNHRLNASSIELVHEDSDFSDKTASISYDPALPTGEGAVSIDPSNSSDLPPALNVPGRMIDLGSQLLATGANALKARVSAEQATSGVSTYTLMWETFKSGIAGSRTYVKHDGTLVNTGNARWDGANWQKDVGGVEASMTDFGPDGAMSIFVQEPGTNTWADGAWTDTTFSVASNGNARLPGGLHVGDDATVLTDGELFVANTLYVDDTGFYMEKVGVDPTLAFNTVSNSISLASDNIMGFYVESEIGMAVYPSAISPGGQTFAGANSFVPGNTGDVNALSHESGKRNAIVMQCKGTFDSLIKSGSRPWNIASITNTSLGHFRVTPTQPIGDHLCCIASIDGGGLIYDAYAFHGTTAYISVETRNSSAGTSAALPFNLIVTGA